MYALLVPMNRACQLTPLKPPCPMDPYARPSTSWGVSPVRTRPAALVLAMFVAVTSSAQADGPFYSAVQRDGVWWFATPAQHIFFSLGVNCVGRGYTESPNP